MRDTIRCMIICLTLFFCVGGFSLYGDVAHPFNVHDLLAFQRVDGAQVSPDGKWVVFTLKTINPDANRGTTDLWIVGTDGKGLRQLTADPANDSSPYWTRDGKTIYFLSGRSGSSQVWKLSPTGGEASPVTQFSLDVGSFVLSPDGSRIALTMEVFPNTTIEETLQKLEELKNKKSSGRIYTRLFVRHWDTWAEGLRSHIFVMPIGGGQAVDIMKAMDADSPAKPFGDEGDFTFTPDSKSVVFTAQDSGREEAWSTNYDLFLAPVDASQAPTCLTEKNKARDQRPVFSPDGKTLAYLAMRRPVFEADRNYLILRSWPGGTEQVLAEKWDRSVDAFMWSSDNKTIYAIADNLGQKSLFAVEVKTGTVSEVIKDGTVTSIGLAGPRTIVYGMHHLKNPTELYAYDMKAKKSKPITAINAERLAQMKLGDYEQFSFKGWNNETVYAYIVKPVDFDPQKKYPLALLIHGGPQGSMANEFHYRWNPQIYAGAGYATLSIDFHASTGYGQAFSDAVRDDWGGKPFEDIQKGLAAALAKYPWMDGDRVAALGASYGAFMVNWIAGNWPDRFRCLVTHDGNLDERAAYFDTEELWFPEWEHNGTPWDNPEGYAKHNPVDFVKNWKTPMLVVHGGKDYRIVDSQGISTFTALQRRGIPSKFLYFPDENHWVLKPQNSILWYNTVLDWLNEWTKK
ncbi:MAG: prolyl oligopeptidase family serine peptidase [Candidatus Omnitrophota bacterium]